jgi:hypothetical protein
LDQFQSKSSYYKILDQHLGEKIGSWSLKIVAKPLRIHFGGLGRAKKSHSKKGVANFKALYSI